MNYQSVLVSFALAAAITGAIATAAFSVYAADKIVKIDGSSTVYPITEAVAEEFQKASGGIKVTVDISGTGGGFKKFCRGEIDISDASRPIQKSEMEDCRQAGIQYIELPIAYDAITVVINPKNTWAEKMTVPKLKAIWGPAAQDAILKWNQVNPKWPDAPFKLLGPGADSGTFEYFTEAIVGKAKESRGDFTASEDDNVLVSGVSDEENGLAYFAYAYYAENKDKLKAVAIDAGKGAITPSPQSVEDGTYQPLSRPIFIYVNAKSAEKPEVKRFVEFYLQNAPALVKEVKYIPLPLSAYKTALAHFKHKKLGTVFAGEAVVGLKIDELLKREASL